MPEPASSRDALIFEDRDFSRGVYLGDPNAVAACPLAINELTGVAPVQPGGFGASRDGPMVPEGDYLVTITANGRTMRRVLRVERVSEIPIDP